MQDEKRSTVVLQLTTEERDALTALCERWFVDDSTAVMTALWDAQYEWTRDKARGSYALPVYLLDATSTCSRLTAEIRAPKPKPKPKRIPRSYPREEYSVWGNRNPSRPPQGIRLSFTTPRFGWQYFPVPNDPHAKWERKYVQFKEPSPLSIPDKSEDVLTRERFSSWESDRRYSQHNGFWLRTAEVVKAREYETHPNTIAFFNVVDSRSLDIVPRRMRRWAAWEFLQRSTKAGGVMSEVGAIFMTIDDEEFAKKNKRRVEDLESLVIERLWKNHKSYLFINENGRLCCSWKYLRQWLNGELLRLEKRSNGIRSGLVFESGATQSALYHQEWGKLTPKHFPDNDDGDENSVLARAFQGGADRVYGTDRERVSVH